MIPELEKIYPEGSDITIMNTHYSYPKFEDGRKIEDDHMFIVYKDNSTRKKGHIIINSPKYTFYKIKDGIEVPRYNQLFIEREKVDPVTVPYSKLEANIAKLVGKEDEYKANIANRNRYGNRVFHTEPNIFFSDVNIEDHYRFKFANTYTNDIKKLSKGFFDIEVDGKWAKGDFVEMGECAINCVSFYDEGTDISYTFILRDERNPQINALEKEIMDGKFGYNEIHTFVVDAVGGQEAADKFGLTNTQYVINFYDEEIQLIADLFRTMHQCSPDFIEGWNSSSFDMPYIITRIENLGYIPEEIMCDPTWEVKLVKHVIDKRNENDLAERGDFTFISGLPVFIDQMIQYASRRKSKIGSFNSFKLDDIGLKEVKVRKLDYHHITDSVLELPWLDFKTFVLYNIMDVIVQKCIESKTQDLDYIFAKCVVNNTIYRKGHRQTTYLVNRMAADWYKMGYIIGNNTNTNNPEPPKYLGALVGKPENTNNYSKMQIDGRYIWVCENLIDYDFKSLYPSIMGEDNIAPNTQIGKIEIPEKVYKDENAYGIEAEKYSRGGEFIENMVTDNHIEFCHRWFHLANFTEMLDDIDEYYKNLNDAYSFSNMVSVFNCPIEPVSSVYMNPLVENVNRTSPLVFNSPRNKDYNYYKLKEGIEEQ